jgi:uncharacterized membrane protein
MKFELEKMNDAHKLLISYAVALAICQVVFFAEGFFVIVKTVSVLFWLLVLPGLGITYLWELQFTERLALAVAISAGIVGIASYYLGLAGIHVTISSVALPVICIIAGTLVVFRKKVIKAAKK